MEYLDTYDENKNFLGKQTRQYVHENALWHNTVHCWLYDEQGNVYFQIRKEEGTLYTTASGHVAAGETIKEAFGREVKEEIGIDINYDECELVDIVVFKMDKIKSDGSIFKDRAFANVYVCKYCGNNKDFNFDLNELDGLVKINAKETLKLLENENGEISAEIIKNENGNNIIIKKDICFTDFLVNKHETAIEKYRAVLEKIIELTL